MKKFYTETVKLFPEKIQETLVVEFANLVTNLSGTNNKGFITTAMDKVKKLLEFDSIDYVDDLLPNLWTLTDSLYQKAKDQAILTKYHPKISLHNADAKNDSSVPMPCSFISTTEDYINFYTNLLKKEEVKSDQQSDNNASSPQRAALTLVQQLRARLRMEGIEIQTDDNTLANSLTNPQTKQLFLKSIVSKNIMDMSRFMKFTVNMNDPVVQTQYTLPITQAPQKKTTASKRSAPPKANVPVAKNIRFIDLSHVPPPPMPLPITSITRTKILTPVNSAFPPQPPLTKQTTVSVTIPSPQNIKPSSVTVPVKNVGSQIVELSESFLIENLFYCCLLLEKIYKKSPGEKEKIFSCHLILLQLVLCKENIKDLPLDVKTLLDQKVQLLQSEQRNFLNTLIEINIDPVIFGALQGLLSSEFFNKNFESLKNTLTVLLIQTLQENNINDFDRKNVQPFLSYLLANYPSKLHTITNLATELHVNQLNSLGHVTFCNSICNIYLNKMPDDTKLQQAIGKLIEKIIPNLNKDSFDYATYVFYHFALALDVNTTALSDIFINKLKQSNDADYFRPAFMLAIDYLLKIKDVTSKDVDSTILAKVNSILTSGLHHHKFQVWENRLIFKIITKYIDKFALAHSSFASSTLLIVKIGLNAVDFLRSITQTKLPRYITDFQGKALVFFRVLLDEYFSKDKVEVEKDIFIYNNIEFVNFQIKQIILQELDEKNVQMSLLNEYFKRNESLQDSVWVNNLVALASTELQNIDYKYFAKLFVHSLEKTKDSSLLLDIIHTNLQVYKEVIQNPDLFALYCKHPKTFKSLYVPTSHSCHYFNRPLEFLVNVIVELIKSGELCNGHQGIPMLAKIMQYAISIAVDRVNKNNYDVAKAQETIKGLLNWKSSINSFLKNKNTYLLLRLPFDFRLFNVKDWDFSCVYLNGAQFHNFVDYRNQELGFIEKATITGHFLFDQIANFRDANAVLGNDQKFIFNFYPLGENNQPNCELISDVRHFQLVSLVLLKKTERDKNEIVKKDKLITAYRSLMQEDKSEPKEALFKPKTSDTIHPISGLLFLSDKSKAAGQKRKHTETEEKNAGDNNSKKSKTDSPSL